MESNFELAGTELNASLIKYDTVTGNSGVNGLVALGINRNGNRMPLQTVITSQNGEATLYVSGSGEYNAMCRNLDGSKISNTDLTIMYAYVIKNS